MQARVIILATAVVASVTLGALHSRVAAQAEAKKPAVTGKWVGIWGPFLPVKPGQTEQPRNPYTAVQCVMECVVVEMPGGKWQATFEGECGRPYKYTIPMEGRQAGDAVLFKGTVDLGAQDGGVYDWIGKATEKQFVGFFTSSGHEGSFTMEKAAVQP